MVKSVVSKVITALLVVICLSSIYQKVAFPDRPVNIMGYSLSNIVSGSMEPEIEIGSVVVIKSSQTYNIGDVVTYKSDSGRYITHRIIKKDLNGYVITKGDANNVEDGAINISSIVGKVVLTIPYIGNLSSIRVLVLIIAIYLMLIGINKLNIGRGSK